MISGMSAHPTSPAAHPRRMSAVLTWALSAAVVLVIGWFLFALSEQGMPRTGGVLLLVAGAVAAVTAVLTARGRASGVLQRAASAGLVMAGVAAAVLQVSAGNVFVADLVVSGAVPVLAGVATWLVGRR
jgi:hypothetical protein